MKISQLRDFLAVARAGSLRGAARNLGLSQPTLTRNIKLLEHDIGATLFVRSGNGVVLTTAGETFLSRAQVAWNELQRGQSDVRQLADASGVNAVSLGISAAPALRALPSAIRSFRLAFPGDHIRISPGNFPTVQRDLQSGLLDFSVGPRNSGFLGDGFTVERLFENTRKVVARIGHPLAKARSLRELLEAEWVITGGTGSSQSDFFGYFQQHFIDPPKALIQCEYSTALFSILAASDMLALLPAQWIETPLAKGFLEEIKVKEIIKDTDICMVYRKDMPPTRVASELMAALRKHCR